MLRENLIILRNVRGWSQEEVAERIGISRQAYAKWESGATVPDIKKCMRLAEVYGTTIDSLVKTTTVDGKGVIPPRRPAGISGAPSSSTSAVSSSYRKPYATNSVSAAASGSLSSQTTGRASPWSRQRCLKPG